jgi:hypothetical protein
MEVGWQTSELKQFFLLHASKFVLCPLLIPFLGWLTP